MPGGGVDLEIVEVALFELIAGRDNLWSGSEPIAVLANSGTEVQGEPKPCQFYVLFSMGLDELKGGLVGEDRIAGLEGVDDGADGVYGRGNSRSMSPVWMIPSRRR